MTKKIELQIANWFYSPKLHNDPLHFKRTYHAHFILNALDVKLQNLMETQGQHNNDQKS